VLNGRYQLDSPIAKGAAGDVWRGHHISIGKRVAVKVLKAEHAQDDDDWATKRMLREARLLSELDDPAIVDVIDFGREGGCPYIVMELLEGRTLAAALRTDGPMPWSNAGPLLQQMIEGLASAHRAGVIHRDLKPANIILLADDTRAKLVDFGIAGSHKRTRITVDGEVLGTPHFMSPEQSRTMDLTAPSDVYSLGCVAFSMLSGRPPYVGKVGEIVRQHLTGPVPAVSEVVGGDVPVAVCKAIRRCMAKKPEERFASMEALHVGLFGRPLGSVPGASTGRTRARGRKAKRGVAVAAAAGVALVGGLAVVGVTTWNAPTSDARPAGSVPVHRPASVASPHPAPAPMAAENPPAPTQELPVEVARPKANPAVTPVAERPVRPRKPKRVPDGASPEASPEPTAPTPTPTPTPAAEPDDLVQKVGGLKNPFDGE